MVTAPPESHPDHQRLVRVQRSRAADLISIIADPGCVVAALGPGLRIRVSNTGRPMPAATAVPGGACDGTGTGLRNVAQGLELASPRRHTFSVTEREGWVHAEIALRPAVREATP